MSEAVTKTVTGACEEVSERNGWTQFAINVGSQYPVKLSTKLDPLVELGRAAAKDGGAFDWTYKESQGGENPHKPGTFYTNRYLESVEAAGTNPNANVSPSAPAEGMSKDEWRRKDDAIHETALIKAAADALKHTIPSDPSDEDLSKFLARCSYLVGPWMKAVLTIRDGGPNLSEHDQNIPF